MHVTALVCMLFGATALASHQEQQQAVKRTDLSSATAVATANATATLDPVKISSELQALMGDMTFAPLASSPTVTLAISIPTSLRNEILTAVPASVVIQLVNSGYRESMASEFAAGSTPAWYQSLDPDLQSFFQSMAKAIKTGSAVYTQTPTATTTDASGADATEGLSVQSTSSSSGLAAAPTAIGREMVTGIWALAGAAGVALML